VQLSQAELGELVEQARGTQGIIGYHNSNHRVKKAGRVFLVRAPLDHVPEMDLRIWSEPDVLNVARGHRIPCPRLFGVLEPSGVQVQEYITGVVVDQRWPRGIRVPTHVLGDLAAVFLRLATVGAEALPPLPTDWPVSGDAAGLLRRLMDMTRQIYDSHKAQYGWIYETLTLPDDPLVPLERLPATLSGSRPFVLCHCDVHRGNCISRDGRTVFLDWEIALYGDPAYDLAAHLHKTGYQPDEELRFLELVTQDLSSTATRCLVSDIAVYRAHERVKSIIVDAVRYRLRVLSSQTPEQTRSALATRLASKLAEAAPIWGGAACSRATVEDVLRA